MDLMFTWNNQLNAEEQTQRSLEQVGAQKSTNTKKHVQRNLEESTRTIQGEKTEKRQRKRYQYSWIFTGKKN